MEHLGFTITTVRMQHLRRLRILVIAVLVFSYLSLPAARADFERGVSAMKQGDYPAAFKEWVKSAADGHLRAQYNLGVLYENGLGVEKNPTQAAKWYIVSAEGNYAPAQYNLAVLYYYGSGVPHSKTSALKWYMKAALQLDELAMYAVGQMYANGDGVSPDLTTAYMWLYLSKKLGHADSPVALEAISPLLETGDMEKAMQSAEEWLEGKT